MKLISGSLTILLMCIQTCWLASFGDICQLKGKDVVIHRNYKTGESLCCLQIRCSRGEEAVMCARDDPWSTTCQSCPDGTYQPDATDSADMLHCFDKTQCRGNLSARHEKSKTKDTRCICDPKLGVCNPAGITRSPRSCVKKTCAPGFRLLPNCSCEVCVKPENGNKREQKPCDKRNRLCRTKRETPGSETQLVAICPEDDPEPPTEAPNILQRKDDIEKTGLISPPSVEPFFSSLISDRLSSKGRGGRDDVTNDDLNKDVSRDHVNKSIEWYLIVIPVIFAVGLVLVILCLIIKCKRPLRKSISTSPSSVKKSPSAGSNSTGDTEIAGIRIETKTEECLSLMTPNSEAAPASGVTDDNGMMKPCDKEKLTTLRLFLAENLIFGEYLWAFLQSNGTVTSEMKAQIEKSSSSDSEKAGALITCLLKRDSRAFATFVAALIYTKQEYLARALDPTLTVEIKQYCPEDQQLMDYAHELVQSNADVGLGTTVVVHEADCSV